MKYKTRFERKDSSQEMKTEFKKRKKQLAERCNVPRGMEDLFLNELKFKREADKKNYQEAQRLELVSEPFRDFKLSEDKNFNELTTEEKNKVIRYQELINTEDKTLIDQDEFWPLCDWAVKKEFDFIEIQYNKTPFKGGDNR